MSFDAAEFIGQFDAGEPIHVSEFDLSVMENVLVARYLPFYTNRNQATLERFQGDWEHRSRLIDEVRGQGFFGKLIDPVIQCLDNPADALRAARIPGKSKPHNPDPENVIGLQLTSDIKSSHADIQGAIARRIWYVRREDTKYLAQYPSFWRRFTGDNSADNTINAVASKLSRSGSSSLSRSGSRTGGRAPVRRR